MKKLYALEVGEESKFPLPHNGCNDLCRTHTGHKPGFCRDNTAEPHKEFRHVQEGCQLSVLPGSAMLQTMKSR